MRRTCNVKLRRLRAAIVTVERQYVLRIVSVCLTFKRLMLTIVDVPHR